jgi:arylsulfatase A-like enzyme
MWALGLAASSVSAAERPNILLITLDTTRADRLGFYGYERPTSPNLDALAQRSVVYERAFSTSSWTLPAHASLFTGLFPTSHGAHYDAKGPLVLSAALRGPDNFDKFRASPLRADVRTLAEILSEAGYASAGIVAGPWLKRIFGVGRGFGHYDDEKIDNLQGRLAESVTDSAIAWLAARSEAPFFLFLNYYDPHGPYADPSGYARHFLPPNTRVFPPPRNPSAEFTAGVYDGEIRYMDEQIGRLIAWLQQRDMLEALWIIVTADHGEMFGANGESGHGRTLYQGELRIPLLVKYPAGKGPAPGRVQDPVQLTDVLPLILDRLEIALPEATQGGVPPAVGHAIYAEVYPVVGIGPIMDWRALMEGDFKYLWNSGGASRLYDLASDSEESTDLAASEPERTRQMSMRLESFVSSLPVAPTPADEPDVTVDDETRRALQGLGYLE